MQIIIKNDNFRKKVVVSFCTILCSLLTFLFSLNCRFQIKVNREEIREYGGFALQSIIKNDNFRKKVVVSFCTISLFTFHFSLFSNEIVVSR